MTTFTATYSPDDNKIRLYASSRLDPETYARVKAAGFKWAPKQDLFVAPMWTPAREDLATELAGEIGDEDTSLCDRAEERADRFEVYGEKRMADAHAARKAVAAIADNIPFGQPILVGHHSERHARRDAEKIENGMRKAVKMWRTSQYWESRAAGALRHAKYKELPAVRARRIKTIEADKRKTERTLESAKTFSAAWLSLKGKRPDGTPATTREIALFLANRCHMSFNFTLAEYPRELPISQYEGDMGIWGALDHGIITAEQARDLVTPCYARSIEHCGRWLEHYENRLVYERAMLEEAGASGLLAPKPRRELAPLLNYRAPGGSITTANMYDRNRDVTYPQVNMTKAEYVAINSDYRGARVSQDKTHRFRTAIVKHSLVCVFLTDSKVHDIPSKPEPQQSADDIVEALAELDAADAAKAAAEPAADPVADALALADAIVPPAPADLPDPSPAADFEAMARTLKAGVKVVSAHQLFPTPRELAAEMVEVAALEPGQRILEPSAGTGNIVWEIIRSVSAEQCEVTAVEINYDLCKSLGRAFSDISVHHADFLETSGLQVDRILMNPPFVNGADIKHIEHARKFLKPGGRLVAICADGPRQRERLQPIASEWRSLPAGTFKESGTMVNAALLVIDG